MGKGKFLPFKLLFISGCVSIYTSCGGGGGDDILDSYTGSSNNTGSSNTSSYINLKSLSIVETEKDGIINLNEEFYIYWDVDFSGSSIYHIEFFSLPNQDVPDAGNGKGFISLNCGISNNLLDCSKGIRCVYTKDNNLYYLNCSYYSTFSNNWTSPTKKEIDPATTNYIGADALIFTVNSDYTLGEKHSKKAIPVNFGF